MQECGNARRRKARMKNDKTAPFSPRRRAGDEVTRAKTKEKFVGITKICVIC
jgi:hypothetical protein